MLRVAGVACLVFAAAAAAQVSEPDRRLAEARYKNGLGLMRAESWDEAAEEFKAAVALDPYMALAYYNLGQCRMSQKRFVEAVAAYKRCREAFESISTLSQKEKNAREKARRDEILELKNDLQRLQTFKIVNIERETVRIEDRIRLLESLQASDTQDFRAPAEVSLALGSAYFRQNRLEDAEREYSEAVRLNRKLGAAHNNLAVIYMMTGRLGEAQASVTLAEKCGFPVSSRFKDDLKNATAAHP